MMKTMKKAVAFILAVTLMLTGISAFAELNTEDLRLLDTYYTLATNYISMADYDKAAEYVDKCFEYCNENTGKDLMADLYLKRGCIETIHGDTEAALADLDKALENNAELADAYLIKTEIYTDSLDFAQATENLQKYIDLTGDNDLYATLSELYELNGEAEKAADSYTKYIKSRDITENEAVYTEAVYKMQIGLNDEALVAFETLKEDETYGEAAQYNIAVCLMNKGENEAAAEIFIAGIQDNGWADKYEGTYYNLGLCYMLNGDYEKAEENFIASVEKNEYPDESNQNIGICKMSREDYEGAIEAFMKLEKEDTALDPAVAFYRACCYVSVGNNEAALKDFTYCIDNGYELAQSYYQRSAIYGAMGEIELQTADLEASLAN